MNLKFISTIFLYFCLNIPSISQCPSIITLTSQLEIDNFSVDYPGCTILQDSRLVIEENQSGNIKNLDGLSDIISIGNGLQISRNDSLINLDGLNQITYVGGNMFISENPSLVNINGFDNLDTVSFRLLIANNNKLLNIDGFNKLSYLGWFTIRYNDALLNFNGFNQLDSIQGNLNIFDNVSLSSINALNSLVFIEGDLIFWENNSITNINGINQLSRINKFISISDNASLTNINFLSEVRSVGAPIYIDDNPQLDQCCAICPLLAADLVDTLVINGSINITNNLIGCNSPSEIHACHSCNNTVCFPDLVLTPGLTGNYIYLASNSISSTDQVIVSENIQYTAGSQIELKSGFSVSENSTFSAFIGGCQE